MGGGSTYCSISLTCALVSLIVWKTYSSPLSLVLTNSKSTDFSTSLVDSAWNSWGVAAPHSFTNDTGWWVRRPVACPLPDSRGELTL